MTQAESLLWCYEAGILDICSNIPCDYTKMFLSKAPVKATVPPVIHPQKSQSVPQSVPETPELSITSQKAKEVAGQSQTMPQLYENLMKEFADFPACKWAMHTLIGQGTLTPDVVVVLDMPNADEDKQGRFLCGPAGEKMAQMLASINLDTEKNCYLTSLLPWRLPGDRLPTELELVVGKTFLSKKVALLKPKLLLFMGQSLTSLLTKTPFFKALGQWYRYQNIPALMTYSPKMVMFNNTYRKPCWDHLCMLKQAYEAQEPPETNGG